MGVISPVGNSIDDFWTGLTHGRCGLGLLNGFDEYDLPVHVAGQVKDFNPKLFGMSIADIRRSDLYSRYAMSAAIQAVAESGLVSGDNISPSRLGVYIGSAIGGIQTLEEQSEVLFKEGAKRISPLLVPMICPNMAGGNIAIKFNAQGPCISSVSACASSSNTIGEAYHAIMYGYADAIIAGGSEAAVHPIALGGFANCKALSLSVDPQQASLPFNKHRNGFVMAEGAGIIILEEYEHAKARCANIIAEVTGYGVTCDAYHCTAPRPDGTVAARAIKGALEDSNYSEGEDLYINAHGTGTYLNDKTETLAIKLALGEKMAKQVSISSTKSMTGHMLGAAGAVELIASVLALRDSIIPPTIGLTDLDPECDLDNTPLVARKRNISIALSNSLGFGGHNVCVALRKVV